MNHLGSLLIDKGEFDKAENYIRREKALPPEHWLTAVAMGTLGQCLSELNYFDNAERFLTNSVRVLYEQRGVQDTLANRMGRNLIKHFDKTDNRLRADSVRILLNESSL